MLVNTSGGTAFERCQQGQFGGVRVATGGVGGVLEIAVGALIGVVIQRLVHPVKVESRPIASRTRRSANSGFAG